MAPIAASVGYDDTVIDLAGRSGSDLDAVAVLARACGSRRTTSHQLRACLDARSRIARRAWLETVLDDVESGTRSVLEHGYQARVVRPHDLPAGLVAARQQPLVRTSPATAKLAGRYPSLSDDARQ